MSSITFTPSTGAAITIVGSIVYGSDFFHRRPNQIRLECSDGTDYVLDSGLVKGYMTLVVKRLSYADGDAFRTWIQSVLKLQLYTFTIGAITNVNLGAGKNTQVTGCRYLKNDTEGLLEYVAPGMYNLTMEYSF
jgi:hypothetical protein